MGNFPSRNTEAAATHPCGAVEIFGGFVVPGNYEATYLRVWVIFVLGSDQEAFEGCGFGRNRHVEAAACFGRLHHKLERTRDYVGHVGAEPVLWDHSLAGRQGCT